MHGLRQIFGTVVEFFVGDAEAQLGRAFGIGNVMKHKLDTVNIQRLCGFVNQNSGGKNGRQPVHHVLAQAGIDIAFCRTRQILAKLVHRTPAHSDADHDVLAGGFFHEALGRNDGQLEVGGLLGRGHAQNASKMVNVRVGKDDGRDRLVTQVLPGECKRYARRLCGGQRVHHNPAGLALDQGHVGDVKAAKLVDAFHHLEEPDVRVQLGVPPKAGVDGVGRLVSEEGIDVKVLQNCAVGCQNLAGGFGNESPLGIFKINRVIKFQLLRKSCVCLHRRGSRVH